MQLGRLIEGLAIRDFRGDSAIEIKGLAYDSRAVRPGDLFVALRGSAGDGHKFINDALQNGAVAVVAEQFDEMHEKIALIRTSDSRKALSFLAANFFKRPFKDMNLIGITGTNGKTTTSYLLESILSGAGAKPGVIGTINYRFSGKKHNAPVTTPESLDLMRILANMKDKDVTDVIVEVSSHALAQGRTRDCPFRIAVFTNISRDHLDYHGTMERYFEAKSLLFRGLSKDGAEGLSRAVINTDDPKGKDLAEITGVPVVTYGLGDGVDVTAIRAKATMNGLAARLLTPAGEIDVQSSLIGVFNIYNILAASAAALCLGMDLEQIASGIASLKGVPGRLELVKNNRSLPVVVDYAHTPDALLKVLEAVKQLVSGRLITVFGCGGDRDKGKRMEMGRVAGKLSDLIFITSDNPRTEDPAAIAIQIEKGVREAGMEKLSGCSHDWSSSGYMVDLDRANAIGRAVLAAGEKDLIIIAGKGHEDYQITGTDKRHFDDRETAAKAASKEP